MYKENQNLETKELVFSNGNRGFSIKIPLGTPANLVIERLNIEQPKAVILVFGSVLELDNALTPQLLQLFSRSIVQAAAKKNALIIDCGIQAGTMELIGKAVAKQEGKLPLIGIAPSSKIIYPDESTKNKEDKAPLDPNHSHFILVDCNEWGCENRTIFEIAATLSENTPVVSILVNGGENAKKEVLQSVRHDWPIIVIEKTGRLADQISEVLKDKTKEGQKSAVSKDSEIAEIASKGNIHLFPIDGSAHELEQLIRCCLQLGKCETLRSAWEMFAAYDLNALEQQKYAITMQNIILSLGILATFLVLGQKQFQNLLSSFPTIDGVLRYAIIIMPILISILIAGTNRFKPGSKWILLRASAEAIKQEIFRYRTRTGIYHSNGIDLSSEAKLNSKLLAISTHLMQTEANLSALKRYKGKIPPEMYGAAANDDGFSILNPEDYIKIRIGDQLSYYQSKTVKLEKKLKRLQWLIYIFGGIGTFLAAIGLELWIALTTTIVGALAVYLEYHQVENTLMTYNQTANDLINLKCWWSTLTPKEKTNPDNFDKLVNYAEDALKTETAGWTQRMEDALAGINSKQTKPENS